MSQLGWMLWAPVLQSLEMVMRLLLAGALLFIMWEVTILLATLISIRPPGPARPRGS